MGVREALALPAGGRAEGARGVLTAGPLRGCTWPRCDRWAWAACSEEAPLRNDTVRGFVPFGPFLLIFLCVLFCFYLPLRLKADNPSAERCLYTCQTGRGGCKE